MFRRSAGFWGVFPQIPEIGLAWAVRLLERTEVPVEIG
jgi:hypothetical protein